MRKSVFGIALIAGPILFLVQALLSYDITLKESEFLASVADTNTDAVSVAAMLSMLCLVAALLHLRERAGDSGLGQVGGGLAVVGLITQPIWIGVDASTAAIAATGTGAEQVALMESVAAGAGVMIAMLGAVLYALGTLLLGVALLRSKALPAWQSALIAIFPLCTVVGFAGVGNTALIAAGAIAILGMTPVGLKLLGGEEGAAAMAPAA